MPSFAVIPAAGRSRRMRTPKLLLPWGESTIIEATLSAWQASGVNEVVVVTHPDDDQLTETCRAAGATVAVADHPPPDMKASILVGLHHVEQAYAPHAGDAWLTAPADVPGLLSAVIDLLLAEHRREAPSILVPDHNGRRGHPVLLPWSLAGEVARLPDDAGIDQLVAVHGFRSIECANLPRAEDVDTPEEYDRLRARDGRS